MSEYPEDVMKAAREAVMPLLGLESPDGARIIARAIMAERERCVKTIEARIPLYTSIVQVNALRECISSINS